MDKLKIVTSFLLLIAATFSDASSPQVNLSYSISLNKQSFLPMEPIIVISKLKNIGSETIEVNEPCAPKFVVTYDLFKLEPNGLVQVRGRTMDHPAGPIKFILEPNDTCESSCELHITNGSVMVYPGLQPGEYLIKSKYHFKRYGTLNYNDDAVISEVPFHIMQRNADQEKVFKEFSENLNDASKLSSFIDKYPVSPYRQYALDRLVLEIYQRKDYKEEIRIYQEMLKGQLSTYRRERILLGTADTYLQLGDVKGAIKLLSNEKIPNVVRYRKQLEEGKIPSQYRDAVKKAKEATEPNIPKENSDSNSVSNANTIFP